jgi:hypothetical protein
MPDASKISSLLLTPHSSLFYSSLLTSVFPGGL